MVVYYTGNKIYIAQSPVVRVVRHREKKMRHVEDVHIVSPVTNGCIVVVVERSYRLVSPSLSPAGVPKYCFIHNSIGIIC